MSKFNTHRESIRIAGKLKEIVTIKDETGNVIHKVISPLMVEFYPRDIIQVIVGATILAIPIGFTEEVWNLGSTLPLINILSVATVSILFIAVFVYHNIYGDNLKHHRWEFIKRVAFIYLFSMATVAVVLTMIDVLPWGLDLAVAFKRIVLVAFPASMSATIADMVK